ncbi:hypothetical protein N658DRAFT_297858 [Parathielavia hyrcaniae]|uniref:Uncharacterized protein n=1 Tax=Parathielavia hyrcaniae TaxID=113614 RepID=A0AAN6T2T2_9PEZI|nr:hypothetical protein N658DRAFT_297858 [Parathielavia hyrcaniae]
MFVPQDSLVDFLMHYVETPLATSRFSKSQIKVVEGFARHFIDLIAEKDSSGGVDACIKEMFARIWHLDENKGLAILPNHLVDSLLRAVVDAQDWEFFEQVTSRLGGCPPVDFFMWMAEQLVSGDSQIETGLLAAALTSTTPFDRVLAAHRALPVRTAGKPYQNLLSQLIAHVSEDLDIYGSCSQVGQLLVDLLYTAQGLDTLCIELPALVEKHAAHSAFVLGVLRGFHCPAFSFLPQGLFEQLSQSFVDALDFSKLFQRAPHAWKDRGCVCAGQLSSKPASSSAIDALELAAFIFELLARKADSVVASFAFKVARGSALIPPKEFTPLWLPFLGHLIKVLEKHHVSLSTPRCRHLFATVLESFVARCVGALPRKWAPQVLAVYCVPACRICSLFTRFLRSSVSAASFTSVSRSEADHINRLAQYATAWRCHFKAEGEGFVVTKVEEVDAQADPMWMEG